MIRLALVISCVAFVQALKLHVSAPATNAGTLSSVKLPPDDEDDSSADVDTPLRQRRANSNSVTLNDVKVSVYRSESKAPQRSTYYSPGRSRTSSNPKSPAGSETSSISEHVEVSTVTVEEKNPQENFRVLLARCEFWLKLG